MTNPTTAPPKAAHPFQAKMFIELIALAEDLLHPEQLGHAATAEIRDRARLCLGIPACESHLAKKS